MTQSESKFVFPAIARVAIATLALLAATYIVVDFVEMLGVNLPLVYWRVIGGFSLIAYLSFIIVLATAGPGRTLVRMLLLPAAIFHSLNIMFYLAFVFQDVAGEFFGGSSLLISGVDALCFVCKSIFIGLYLVIVACNNRLMAVLLLVWPWLLSVIAVQVFWILVGNFDILPNYGAIHAVGIALNTIVYSLFLAILLCCLWARRRA